MFDFQQFVFFFILFLARNDARRGEKRGHCLGLVGHIVYLLFCLRLQTAFGAKGKRTKRIFFDKITELYLFELLLRVMVFISGQNKITTSFSIVFRMFF